MITNNRIVVRTEIVWNTLRRDGPVEHATQGNTIDIPRLYAKTDDTPCELIPYGANIRKNCMILLSNNIVDNLFVQ